MDMYIADTHFGHENVLRQCRPQFSSIEEMNEAIIENINRKMKRSDTLYILGDFAFRSKRSPVEYLEAIKPKKLLILGNHDRDWLRHLNEEEVEKHFIGVYPQFSLKKNGVELYFNHFPQLAWNRSHYFGQTFSICGHIHNARDTSLAARLFPQVHCQFNAGVDINNFEPVTFEELVANNKTFYGRSYTPEEQERLDLAIAKIMA
ncbi:MAG: metallophosphoesterase family protein [Clostridia bacterium]|nr:metallophosphoesterase family protein [Clostridia bacterium]